MSKKEMANIVVNAAVADKHYTDFSKDELNKAIKGQRVRMAVKKVIDGEKKSFEGGWSYVEGLNMAVSEDGFKSDFATRKEFAQFMCLSESVLSKAVRLFSYDNVDFKAMGIPVTVAYEYLPIKEDDRVLEAINDLGLDATAKEVRAYVKALKADEQKAIAGQTEEESDVEAETEESEYSNVDSMEDGEELEIIYRVPIWVNNDGGYVRDCDMTLSESQSEELAKVIRDWMNKKIDAGVNIKAILM